MTAGYYQPEIGIWPVFCFALCTRTDIGLMNLAYTWIL